MKCEVSLNTNECETAWGLGSIRTSCYRCGQAACRECSAKVYDPMTNRRIRMCADCQEQEGHTPPLYHGTRTAFGLGGLLLPQALHGAPLTAGGIRDDEGQHVYVTPEHDLAVTFAEIATGRARPRVLTVLPLGLLERDIATFGGEDREAWRCEAARVVAVERLAS